MADKYFSKFPLINYANTVAVNITERAVVLNKIYNDATVYYSYDVTQYERPDNLAERYYDDPYRSWMLYLNNRVIDPYYDWYMDQETFNDFIVKKYGSIEKASATIKHYHNNWYDDTDMLTVSQYQSLPTSSKKYYSPYYDNQFNKTPMGYVRKKDDKKMSTNSVIAYNVANGTPFVAGNPVKLYHSSAPLTQQATAQTLSSNSTVVVLQHVSGTTSVNATSTWYITDSFTGANTVTTSSTVLSVNIPTQESAFWTPVYNYDYENSLNENNKSIRVLDKTYADVVSKNLMELL